jgi:hypothetical protein
MFAIWATPSVGFPILPLAITCLSQRNRLVAITAGAQKRTLPRLRASSIKP